MQRHNTNSGDCPTFPFTPAFVMPDVFANAVGEDLDEARKRPARDYTGEVPEDVLKHCEGSHTAADGSRVKAAGDQHDDKGLMALICRHDIPLFVCNIDTPGEQQKYFFALLIWLSLHLPDVTTMAAFYDVGCVSARIAELVWPSCPCADCPDATQYDILPAGLGDRVLFVTPALHAYAHQWACQIVFSPRMKPGLGLTDGEGVERLWSRLRFIIATTRHSHVRCRAAQGRAMLTILRAAAAASLYAGSQATSHSGRAAGRPWALGNAAPRRAQAQGEAGCRGRCEVWQIGGISAAAVGRSAQGTALASQACAVLCSHRRHLIHL